MARIGILGGTFDPPHLGHLHLAEALKKAWQLDKIFWIPTCGNPLKGRTPTSASHRLAMLNLLLEGKPNHQILDLELKRTPPIYTIDTLHELKKSRPNDSLFLLLGDDLLPELSLWKKIHEVLKLAPPLVGARESQAFQENEVQDHEIRDAIKKGWTLIPQMPISSTNIRKMLKSNDLESGTLPIKVLDYIRKNDLYLIEREI